MVRAGVVSHPSLWPFCGYNEIQKPRRKQVLINYEKLKELFGAGSYAHMRNSHKEWIEAYIRDGLKKATWPGRLQIIRTNPNIILDGAQNLASMSALISSIKGIFKYKKLICVFGISSDKDIKGVSGILDAAGDIIILTETKYNPRAEKVSKLKGYFQSSRPGIQEIKDADEALSEAIKIADKEDLILVTGSLFLVGDALNYFKNRHSN